MKLHVSDNFSLPLDFVTQSQAILAKRGVGKSYTASVEAEELLKQKYQIVVADPTGAWWGLKSSADGGSPGFPIAIIGGEHADIPLEFSAGEVIADAIVEQRFSAIIDLSLLRKGQMAQRLPQGEKAIFEVMLKHNGVVDRDLLTQETNYQRSSRDAYLSRMMAKKIIERVGT